MACSCSTTNVSRHHVDTAVSEFIADLHSGLLIEASVELVAMAIVYRRGMLGDLLIAFACVGRPKFVKAFEPMLMKNISSGLDCALYEVTVAFVR